MTEINTEIDAEEAQQREALIKEATEQKKLVDDTVILFRKVVDSMPSTTWIREGKRLMALEHPSEREIRLRDEAIEEFNDTRATLTTLTTEWVMKWYATDAVFVTVGGAVEGFRAYVDSLATGAPALRSGCADGALPPDVLEKLQGEIQPYVAVVVMEMMKHAHLVVSEAMKYGLTGR